MFFAIQNALLGMQAEWEPLMFELIQYKDTDKWILQGSTVDEIQTLPLAGLG